MFNIRKLLLPLLVAATLPVMANPIDAEAARQNALQFIHQGKMRRVKGTVPLTMSFTLDRTVSTNNTRPMLYAFNIGEGNGYIIASGDDEASTILGYSDEGSLRIEDMPCNMRSWLEGYADEILWAQQKGTGKPVAKSSGSIVKHDIGNMVPTVWAQKAPYYNQCPKTGSTYMLTGCVATAMAQIMYYWGAMEHNGTKFQHGCDALDAYSTATKHYSVPALPAIETFDWSLMTASKPTSTKAINAVAQLIRYCGQSVNMDYDTEKNGGSGAFSEDVPEAFINHFGYDRGAHYVLRRYMTTEAWENLIYSELAAGRPVFIDGTNSKRTTGHAFICTGYQLSTNKFYINWGWGDSNNGWFALSALKVSTYSFEYLNGAVIGIQPPTHETTTYDHELINVEYLYLNSQRNLTRPARAQAGDNMVEMECILLGSDEEDVTWDYGVGVYDSAGEVVRVECEKDDEELYTAFEHFRFSFGDELPYGTYVLTPVCRKHGESAWRKMYNANSFYVKAEVEETSITLQPSVDIRVTSISSKKKTNSTSYTNKITIANDGCEETFGVYSLKVGGKEIATFEPHIAAGATSTITLGYTSQIKTTSAILLDIDQFGFTHFYNNASESNYGDVEVETYVANHTDDYDYIYGNEFRARLYLSNKGSKTYKHTVTAELHKAYSENVIATLTQNVEIPSHSAQTLEFDFPDLDYNSSYEVVFKFPYTDRWGDKNTETTSDAYTMTQGIVVVTADGEQCHRDIRTSTLTPPANALYVDARHSNLLSALKPGTNPNTLYLLPEGATIPAALQSANVVTGNHAETINLQHGYDFYSPIDFTADAITYTRTFANGHNGKSGEGWSTIVLPFAVESDHVTADGNDISWFQSNDDSGRKFWLYDFAMDNDQTVTFGYVQSMEAYKPYIIAVPDRSWGAAYDLRDKSITFAGVNAHILGGHKKAVTDNGHRFDLIGRTYSAHRSYIYALNPQGDSFSQTTDKVKTEPFTAYFVGYYNNEWSNAVNFQFDTRMATPVKPVTLQDMSAGSSAYTIDGRRINDDAPLSPGIYIINGKKVIVK